MSTRRTITISLGVALPWLIVTLFCGREVYWHWKSWKFSTQFQSSSAPIFRYYDNFRYVGSFGNAAVYGFRADKRAQPDGDVGTEHLYVDLDGNYRVVITKYENNGGLASLTLWHNGKAVYGTGKGYGVPEKPLVFWMVPQVGPNAGNELWDIAGHGEFATTRASFPY